MSDKVHPDRPGSSKRRRQMLKHLAEACRLAVLEGVPDLLRSPGLVQQLVVSDALGHVPCLSYRDGSGDAYLPTDPKQHFEYYSAIEGRRFQTGMVGDGGRTSRDNYQKRILSAAKIFLAVFDSGHPLKLLRVYEMEPATIWEKAASQIDRAAKSCANVTISERWAAEHGHRAWTQSVPSAGDSHDRSHS
jgi:hypothetical protein